MIIKTSGFPEFEISDEVLAQYPYATGLWKMTENDATMLLMTLTDTPLFVIKNMIDETLTGTPSDGVYFIELPSKYMLLQIETDGNSVEIQEADETGMTLEDFISNILLYYVFIGFMLTFANYDIYYATMDENEVLHTDYKLAYVSDTSSIQLMAKSSEFQALADFVRSSYGTSEKMNSKTVLEKLKNISFVQPEIIRQMSIPNDKVVSWFNGNFESEFYNGDAIKIQNSFFKNQTEITSINLPKVETIGNNAFDGCSSLAHVNLPKAIKINSYAFNNCTSLEHIDLPKAKAFYAGTFYGCTALTNINLPNVENLGAGGNCFNSCTSLEKLILPKCYTMGNYTFEDCTKLKAIDFYRDIPSINQYYFTNASALQALLLRSTTMSKVYSSSTTGTFLGTPIHEGKGFIYVPSELLSSYQNDSLWSKWASYFRPIEDYTVDGTIMGEMDWEKLGITFDNKE